MSTSMVMPNPQTMAAVSQLAILVSESPQDFLRPTLILQQAAIDAAKALLDPLATNIANVQTARRNENRKKRKRGDDEEEQPILQLRQVYTKGYAVKQIWEQAKRILDAAHQETEKSIQSIRDATSLANPLQNGLQEQPSESESQSDQDESNDAESDVDSIAEDDIEDFSGDELDQTDEIEMEEDIEAVSDPDDSASDGLQRSEQYIKDPNGLNDGFFSIDAFNKQSQFLEQMDARGDDDNQSDEDEIDWDADPLAVSSVSSKRQKSGIEDDEADSEDDGPTFGNVDLNAPDSEDEDMLDNDDEDQDLDGAMAGISNANDIRYAEFFEPPPKLPSKSKRMRALPKTQPPPKSKDASSTQNEADDKQMQNDLERAIADVRRDLLDSEDEEDLSDEDEDEDEDSGDELGPRKQKQNSKNLSTHEKQQAAIAAEIRRLEAANVAKRDWQLSGEARAVDRPVNSLIEEDLEFERTGKPIAPVTAETTEEIDALIKRRILAREFDEVIRRVPGSLNLSSSTRRGRIELDDAKPQASLGEIYEAEHQKNADPLSYVDKRSVATKKQHAEIETIWKQVREQLDLLSNMHFKPKRTDVEIKTVEDKPRIAMEDARPVGEIESGEGGMLAPQEVYRPGTDAKGSKDEILLQGGAAVSKEEMSREEKLRRRRREKERAKKGQTNNEVAVLGKPQAGKKLGKKNKEAEKANIIEDLKRGGVKVVGKGGQLQSIGKQKKGNRDEAAVIGSNLKL